MLPPADLPQAQPIDLPRTQRYRSALRDGWVLRRPEHDEFQERFDAVCAEFGIDAQLKPAVPQALRPGGRVDASDRVQAGARLVRRSQPEGFSSAQQPRLIARCCAKRPRSPRQRRSSRGQLVALNWEN
ncbi:Fungal specific transcription factor domain protein [Rhodococcus sp. AW25M09]|nr:Fungal specific transcription factor domain protein [Rhodococcus sp. AW25M09]